MEKSFFLILIDKAKLLSTTEKRITNGQSLRFYTYHSPLIGKLVKQHPTVKNSGETSKIGYSDLQIAGSFLTAILKIILAPKILFDYFLYDY